MATDKSAPALPKPGEVWRGCRAITASPPMWENRPCRNSARWEHRGARFCFTHKPKRAVRVDDKEAGR